MRNKDKRLMHGTLEGYKALGCRCPKCREVWDMYTQDYRKDIFDETTAKITQLKTKDINMDRAYKEYQDKDFYA